MQKPKSKEEETVWCVLDDVLTKCELKRDGTTIRWRANSKVANVADFLGTLFSGELGL